MADRTLGQEETRIQGLQWRPGEVEKASREIVLSADREFYEQKKTEFLGFHGQLLEALLNQGRILSQMRARDHRLLHWLHLETGLESDYLDNLADFWETFQGAFTKQRLRADLSPQFYLQAAQVVNVVEDSWETEPKVAGKVRDSAIKLLNRVNPREGDSPRNLAVSLARLFGIMNLGEKPFNGLIINTKTSDDELQKMAQGFHSLVRPLFLQWAEGIRTKPTRGTKVESAPEPSSPATLMITFTFRVENPPNDLSTLAEVVTEALSASGAQVELVQQRAYSPMRERIRTGTGTSE